MRIFRTLLVALALIVICATASARADEHGSLFVNMTSDDSHRANMAFAFSKGQLDRGHPVTIWLNDKGVFVASKGSTDKLGEPQTALKGLMASGAQVIVCAMCMKHYGVKESDLLDGIKISNPDISGAALFKDDAKALTW